MAAPRGYVLYEGPSMLDGEPIVVVATLHSSNVKTGDMVQTFILRADMSPAEAVQQETDSSICGSCRHRHNQGGACYVLPWQAPQRVYRSWAAGKYPVATRRHIGRLKGRPIRFGSYGDPAAAPVEIWERLAKVAGMTTGYTHQADKLPEIGAMDILDHCMVSADNEAEALFYQGMGARTFRVKRPEDPMLKDEVYCPADANDGIQCIDCGLCSGAYHARTNVAINVHGQRQKRYDPIPAVAVA